jgi:hypothetical protein
MGYYMRMERIALITGTKFIAHVATDHNVQTGTFLDRDGMLPL